MADRRGGRGRGGDLAAGWSGSHVQGHWGGHEEDEGTRGPWGHPNVSHRAVGLGAAVALCIWKQWCGVKENPPSK